jgi:hypothetical protein
MAYYSAWASATTPDRQELLNQARIFLPAGPRVMYVLAMSDRTVAAVRQRIASGEPIDQRDNAQSKPGPTLRLASTRCPRR